MMYVVALYASTNEIINAQGLKPCGYLFFIFLILCAY
jgi:hypothetical protein